ncbi:uncharacterized protein RSE6_00509 [Rhynchosporium secalis]|uniref:Uncharacterized protein n=1 Tax=Rhynchosporium secalis TaxID=38038 RepID=A0A1E1LX55_RHYSE|nr:uncharacterized protein RSE6_00509 [Rhynchosporium secalis]
MESWYGDAEARLQLLYRDLTQYMLGGVRDPDHIGKPSQSFLEIATICRMASLYGFLKAELSWFGKRTQHTYPSATPFTSGEGNLKS